MKRNKKNNLSLQFVLWVFFWILLFVFISLIPFVQEAFLQITTSFTNWLLNISGYETLLQGNKIALTTGTEMKFSIVPDCTGIYPFIILFSLILAFPTSVKNKLIGASGAFLTTFSVNYIRLVLLIAIGHANRELFQYAHVFIFQVSFILLIIIYFLWWIKWVLKKSK